MPWEQFLYILIFRGKWATGNESKFKYKGRIKMLQVRFKILASIISTWKKKTQTELVINLLNN